MHRITRLIGSLRKGNLGICCVLLLWAVLLSAEPLWAQRLLWLGTLPGGDWSPAYGVSADGSVVVGEAENTAGQKRAFRWTASGGMQDLGTLPEYDWSEALGVSADGSVVVGWAGNAAGQYRAFRWTAARGMQDLGTLGGDWSQAQGVSADGSVVVGAADNAAGRLRAFRWTAARGMQDLGTLGGRESVAGGVSADGSVVVGLADNAAGHGRAFRWTAAGGMQDLGTLGGDWSEAWGVSADGSVVVGDAPNAAGRLRAFRWTAAGGMQDLGTLGGDRSFARGVSADGSVVVGLAENTEGDVQPFRWTTAGGMEDLNTTYAHLLTDGSVLYQANAISPNGRYIVGLGYNAATGGFEAYLLDTRPGGPSSVEEKPADELPVEYQLQQNYPNPFNPSTTIRFLLPQRSHVTLKVFDVLGREVATLVDAEMEAGEHSVNFNAEWMPGGVYFAQMKAGNVVQRIKMVLVK
jgi:probable HAF family extracellular repeat protein